MSLQYFVEDVFVKQTVTKATDVRSLSACLHNEDRSGVLETATKKRNTRSRASSHNNAERRADMVDQTSSTTLSDHVALSTYLTMSRTSTLF